MSSGLLISDSLNGLCLSCCESSLSSLVGDEEAPAAVPTAAIAATDTGCPSLKRESTLPSIVGEVANELNESEKKKLLGFSVPIACRKNAFEQNGRLLPTTRSHPLQASNSRRYRVWVRFQFYKNRQKTFYLIVLLGLTSFCLV
jgi:hypothetical protein